MKMQDVENRTGLDRATIRFYEKEGLVTPVRHENGYRSYDDGDVNLLQKIKLLRQLGFSIEKIRRLQQGSEDFSVILSQQIDVLSQQIQKDTMAKQVCLAMQQESVQFSTLDSTRYLNMLVVNTQVSRQAFSETVPKEIHPWRRYFARSIDYALVSAVLSSLLIMVLRIRPFSPNALRVLNYLSYIIAMPILALLQHFWGTTPGKWAMGIRLESINGGKLNFNTALYREISVFCMGMGLQIPIVSLWRLIKSYINDTDGEGNPWNTETEIIYTDWCYVKKAAIGLIAVGSFVLTMISSLDSMLPKHRGEGITPAEFARNYHDYEKMFDTQSDYILTDNGTWAKEQHCDYEVVISGDPNHIRQSFTYELDGEGYLVSFCYIDTWHDAEYQSPIPAYCCTALYALLGSRPGSTYANLLTAEEMIASEINNKLVDAARQGIFAGEFSVNDVRISWEIEAENCDIVSESGWMVSLEDEKLQYSLKLKAEIIK